MRRVALLARAKTLEKVPAELQVEVGGDHDVVVGPRAHVGVAPALEEVVAAWFGRVVAGGAQAAGPCSGGRGMMGAISCAP